MVGLATVFGAGGGTSSYAEIEYTDGEGVLLASAVARTFRVPRRRAGADGGRERSNDGLDGGKGRDSADGGRGNDWIFAFDGKSDVVRCGGGIDRVVVDAKDKVSVSCERVVIRS